MASLLHSPPSNPRVGQVCLGTKFDQLQKGIMHFSVCLQIQKSNVKIYKIPQRAIARPFATAGSLEKNGANGHVSSKILAPNDFERSKVLDDSSGVPMHGLYDFERQLQELFDEVKTTIKEGNINDAVDILRANYNSVKDQMDAGARGIEEAAMLDIITLGYMAVGDLKLVASLLDMLNEVVSGLKNEEPLLDSVLVHMGSMYSVLGKFEKSMLMYRRVLDILERTYGKSNTFLITPLLGIAKVLGSTGKVTEAIEHYHGAMTILELSRGSESEDLVVPLFGLGNLLLKEGRVADAENSFIRILDVYTKLYGENDGRVGMAMCSLAHVKCAKGSVDEAIHLYKSALQIIKDSSYMALDDNIMEKMRIDLAELLHVVGRGKEGRELLEECLLITEKYKGKEHPSLVTNILNLATSYSRSKNFVEAERLLRTSLQILKKSVGPDDQSITFPMLHLAVTLYHLKRDEEAESLALEVLRIREKAFGKESVPVGEALDCLASIQMRLGRDDGALLELLKRVLRIQERELGYESEEVLETLKKIVFYLDRMGRGEEKLPLQRRLSMLRTKFKQRVRY
ncbi:uncharacterized protein LOC131146310 isoform X2 [Malania oleifera]|uniref:uncharacterized protein LOC131146310 isoform X2 n=1 Tax=Malania oleifera TaxID=397392 RepID=UPI0025AE2893|nr:uncharacterized protein LOC131146310 isoform X2 [Malania oleifera]